LSSARPRRDASMLVQGLTPSLEAPSREMGRMLIDRDSNFTLRFLSTEHRNTQLRTLRRSTNAHRFGRPQIVRAGFFSLFPSPRGIGSSRKYVVRSFPLPDSISDSQPWNPRDFSFAPLGQLYVLLLPFRISHDLENPRHFSKVLLSVFLIPVRLSFPACVAPGLRPPTVFYAGSREFKKSSGLLRQC